MRHTVIANLVERLDPHRVPLAHVAARQHDHARVDLALRAAAAEAEATCSFARLGALDDDLSRRATTRGALSRAPSQTQRDDDDDDDDGGAPAARARVVTRHAIHMT